jgi:hypothetical protein
MESNRHSRSQPLPHGLDDLRLSDYDRMLGKRYVEQGEILADIVIRASHGIRTLLGNVRSMLRADFAHRHDYAKNGIVHVD